MGTGYYIHISYSHSVKAGVVSAHTDRECVPPLVVSDQLR